MVRRDIMNIVGVLLIIIALWQSPTPAPVLPEPPVPVKPRPEPKTVVERTYKTERITDVNKRFPGTSLYSKVMSKFEQPFMQGSRATRAHETTHGIHNKYRVRNIIRDNKNDAIALYITPDEIWSGVSPRGSKADIIPLVPQSLQEAGSRYELYVSNPKKMKQGSYDILDEWFAYIIDAEVAIEDTKNGIKPPPNEIYSVDGVLEMGLYTVAVCMADPDIDSDLKNLLFHTFKRAEKVFQEGRVMFNYEKSGLKNDPHDRILRNLKESPDAEPIRKYLRDNFDSAFLNLP